MIYKLVLQNEVEGIESNSMTFRPPAILGREPGTDVCVDHHSISRQHCQFTLNGDGALMVKDLGSTNGIYVDDNRIDHEVLMPNEILQVGALRLMVQMSDEGELSAATERQPSGSVDTTQPMPVFEIDDPDVSRPWWKKLLG